MVVNLQTNVSWTVGFSVPAGAFFIATCVFLLGTPLYRRVPPSGSPFTRIFRVLGIAFKNRKKILPEDACELYEVPGEMSAVPGQPKIPHTNGLKCLDRAAVPDRLDTIKEDIEEGEEFDASIPEPKSSGLEEDTTDKKGKQKKKNLYVTITEVEEVKCILRLLPIAFTLIFYNAIYAQMTTMFILQGEGMDTALGSLNVAPATVSVLDSLSVIIFVFIYDLLITPFFKRIGRPISLLVRIGAGYIVATLSMIVAGVVEVVRLNVVKDNNLQDVDPTEDGAPTVPMSVWWQIPQYALVGISEVLSLTGSMEMFYREAPGMCIFCAISLL